MNKTQFNAKWAQRELPQAELDRKWRVFLEEQDQLMLRQPAPIAASGGSNTIYVEDDFVDEDFVI